MMKKKYLRLLLAVSSIFLLFLSACSSDKGGNTNGSSSETQKTEAIYEHLKNAKNEIWYVTKEVQKPLILLISISSTREKSKVIIYLMLI